MKVCIHTCLNVVQPECYSGWEGWLRGPCGDGQSLGDQLALAGFQSRNLNRGASRKQFPISKAISYQFSVGRRTAR